MVQVVSDNITTVAYLNQLSGNSKLLHRLATALFAWCERHKVQVTAKHLSGMRNVQVDYLSWVLSRHEWQLDPRVFQYVHKTFGPFTIDSETTHLLPQYNSLFLDRYCEAVDAFAQPWGGAELNWINAPFSLIPPILRKIVQDRADACLLAPAWKGAPWYHLLRRLAVRPPLALPRCRGLCVRRAGMPDSQKSEMVPVHMETLWEKRLSMMGWSESGVKLIQSSLASSTWSTYNSIVTKFLSFVDQAGLDLTQLPDSAFADFILSTVQGSSRPKAKVEQFSAAIACFAKVSGINLELSLDVRYLL